MFIQKLHNPVFFAMFMANVLLVPNALVVAQNDFTSSIPAARVAKLGDRAESKMFSIDNTHTSMVFAINHFGISYTYGRFNECSGSFSIENGEPTANGFNFVIGAASIDTNNKERDDHLRGPDFFDSEQFPEIKFKTTGFQKAGNEYLVTGDLQILDQIRSVTLPIQMTGMGRGPFGEPRAGFLARFSIKRSEFGMNKMIGSIGDDVSITFSFEGVAK